jgi:glycosyltransferase involved in cell wall biosynthesis
MGAIHKSAFRAVMDSEPSLYNAVITISPFHSVNPLMVRVKRIRPNVRWIAHFGDPWASNPLENRWLARQWNTWREAQTLRSATYVTHSSPHALELALDSSPFLVRERTRVIPHEFDSELYPSRPKRSNDKITLRFIGTLFGRRSPTPLFLALAQLQERCPEILEAIKVELIGPTDRPLSAWEGFGNLPLGLVLHRPAVNYLESLALMYDADILLVIEADVAATPFVPSKLMDYMGANTPIIGIAPRGGCREILDRLACPTVNPNDIAGIAMALETSIDRIRHRVEDAWCREEVRRSFDLTSGTADFKTLIMDAVPQ